jgi:glycosyltransferase involved in cell wall biosynthesis
VLLCVGRLCWQKNQIGLLRAFARIAASHPQWDLRLVGDGIDRPVLEQMIAELGMGERVYMPGKSNRVVDHLAESHLFCLPSRWEGFPNALAEAMASGLPAVAFRDCAGASDLLRDGVTGLLTSADALPQTLSDLMDSPERRVAMGAAAAAEAAGYSPERSFGCWQALLEELSVPR